MILRSLGRRIDAAITRAEERAAAAGAGEPGPLKPLMAQVLQSRDDMGDHCQTFNLAGVPIEYGGPTLPR